MQVGIQNDGPVTITVDTASSVCIHIFVATISTHKLIAFYICLDDMHCTICVHSL